MTKDQENCKLALENFLESAIAKRLYPGAVVGILWPSGDQTVVRVGQTRYQEVEGRSPDLITEETVFDTASITKSVVTTTLSLLAVERGWWELDQPLFELEPWRDQLRLWDIRSPMFIESEITLRHLLTHSLDLSHLVMSELKNLSAREMKALVLGARTATPPGGTHHYLNSTSIINSLILESLAKHHLGVENLRELFEEWLVRPLELNSSWLGRCELVWEQVAPSEVDPWRGREVIGEIHDESAWKFAEAGQLVGSAGLFSNAPDLLGFLEWLKNQPSDSVLNVKNLSRSQLDDSTTSMGLGWELWPRQWMGQRVSSNTIGKTGFTGCSISYDPLAAVGIVFLNNHIYPKRPASREEINRHRGELHDLIMGFV